MQACIISLRTGREVKLTRCFGCVYGFRAILDLLQSCSKIPRPAPVQSEGPACRHNHLRRSHSIARNWYGQPDGK